MKTIEAILWQTIIQESLNFVKKNYHFLNRFLKNKNFFDKKNYFHKPIGYTQPLELLNNFKEIKYKNIVVCVP